MKRHGGCRKGQPQVSEKGRSGTEQHTAHQWNPGYSLNARPELLPEAGAERMLEVVSSRRLVRPSRCARCPAHAPLRRDPFEQAQGGARLRLYCPGQREARLGKQRLHFRVRAQATARDHEHQHVVQLPIR